MFLLGIVSFGTNMNLTFEFVLQNVLQNTPDLNVFSDFKQILMDVLHFAFLFVQNCLHNGFCITLVFAKTVSMKTLPFDVVVEDRIQTNAERDLYMYRYAPSLCVPYILAHSRDLVGMPARADQKSWSLLYPNYLNQHAKPNCIVALRYTSE